MTDHPSPENAELTDIAKEMRDLADEPIVTAPEGRALLRRGAAEIERLQSLISAQQMREPSDEQISSACFSYRHDYGLLTTSTQKRLRLEARGWLRAWQKELSFTSPESEVRGQAHRDAISPSGGLTSVEAHLLKKGEDK